MSTGLGCQLQTLALRQPLLAPHSPVSRNRRLLSWSPLPLPWTLCQGHSSSGLMQSGRLAAESRCTTDFRNVCGHQVTTTAESDEGTHSQPFNSGVLYKPLWPPPEPAGPLPFTEDTPDLA